MAHAVELVAPGRREGLDSLARPNAQLSATRSMTYSTRIRAVAVVSFSLAMGCGSKGGTSKIPSADTLPLALEHDPCDTGSSSAQKVDTNGDGIPDIVRVMVDGRETCRMVDLNHDGRADSYVYFDGSGNVRRRESDFDRDGRVDEIAYYAAGVPIRKDRETNLDGRLDTWDFYEGGKIHHRLRDSDGDGKVDQWWSWPDPDKIECAVIASDHNGDGRPDLNDVVDVCHPAGVAGADAGAGGAQASSSPSGAGVDGGASLAASTVADAALASAPPTAAVGLASGDAGATTKASASKSLTATKKGSK